MKYKFHFITLTGWFTLMLSICSYAQTDKWNLGLSYQSSPVSHTAIIAENIMYADKYNITVFTINLNYCISEYFEVGGFIGYGLAKEDIRTFETDFLYGANVKLQLLPFVVDTEKLRFRLYTIGKAGLIRSNFSPGNPDKDDIKKEFIGSIYLGSSYYITKHLGVFFEGGYEKIHQSHFNARYGLTLKF